MIVIMFPFFTLITITAIAITSSSCLSFANTSSLLPSTSDTLYYTQVETENILSLTEADKPRLKLKLDEQHHRVALQAVVDDQNTPGKFTFDCFRFDFGLDSAHLAFQNHNSVPRPETKLQERTSSS